MRVKIFDPKARSWVEPRNDGRVMFRSEDGRQFSVKEENGTIILSSLDGEMLLHPISRTQVGFETPID